MLVTGFEAYGGRGLNPAEQVVRALDGQEIRGVRVTGATLPVAYAELGTRFQGLIAEQRPKAVICIGLWPGEPMIRIERVGLNVNDFEIPDNMGAIESCVIEPEGPPARLSTLPVDEIRDRLLEAGLPARVSGTAGSFLCNALLYKALGVIEREAPEVPCGFIHVPYLPTQVAELLKATRAERALELHQRADLASMSLDTTLSALQIAIATTLETLVA